MNKQQQIEEIAKVIFDYVDSRTDKDKVVSIHIFNSVADEEIKQISHNMGIAKALYNAGYRKVPDNAVILTPETPEDREEEMKACREGLEFEKEIEKLKAENLRLSEKLTQVLLSIDTVKEMNAMCNIDEQRKQAVKEFAEKLKKRSYCDNDFMNSKWYRYVFVDEIDELLKEYEK